MKVIASNKMELVQGNTLWLDEQEVTKTDEMTGEEYVEYTYIVINMDGEEVTEDYTTAIAEGYIAKARKAYKKQEVAKQKNAWLIANKASRPEYVKETYEVEREMTPAETLAHDTDENGELIDREVDYEYPTVTEVMEYDYIEVVPEVVEELDEDGNVVVEGVPEHEIRRPADYKTEVEWLCEAELPVIVEPTEDPAGVVILAKRLAAEGYKTMADQITLGYDQYEIDSFVTQEAEARAYKADNNTVVPMISAIANTRGIDLDLLADKILEKADAFKVAVGTVMGAKQRELG